MLSDVITVISLAHAFLGFYWSCSWNRYCCSNESIIKKNHWNPSMLKSPTCFVYTWITNRQCTLVLVYLPENFDKIYSRFSLLIINFKMKVKVLSRNPDNYLRETKHDIHRSKLVSQPTFFWYFIKGAHVQLYLISTT